jgi:hypothetical protein
MSAETLPRFFTLDEMLQKIRSRHDGHVTLMGFTMGWKCLAGTPDTDIEYRGTEDDEIWNAPMYASAYLAVWGCFLTEEQEHELGAKVEEGRHVTL